MPFPVQELIVGHQKPVTVRRDGSMQTALDLMTEHDFTQLPVVDDDGKPLGMVTSDSLLRALQTFAVTTSALGIVDATVRVRLFRPDDDLFDLLVLQRGMVCSAVKHLRLVMVPCMLLNHAAIANVKCDMKLLPKSRCNTR